MLTPEQMKQAMDNWIAKITPSKDRPVLTPEQHKVLTDALGYSGRMISGSKQTPTSKLGEHLAMFNANLIIEGYGKQWFGDLDITRDEKKIQTIAKNFQAKVYILCERDARFENENNPLLKLAVYETDGTTGYLPNPEYAAKYVRNLEDGKLYHLPR